MAKISSTRRKGRPAIEMLGRRFGLLVVVSRGETYSNNLRWLCRCDCGNESEHSGSGLRRGAVQSCGCEHQSAKSAAMTRHGHARKRDGRGTVTYQTWHGMLQRCTNPNATGWHYYGGRGITVCDRWRDFANFLADMGERPEGRTLDRADNDGNYEPGNCRWATAKEQRRNQGTRAI